MWLYISLVHFFLLLSGTQLHGFNTIVCSLYFTLGSHLYCDHFWAMSIHVQVLYGRCWETMLHKYFHCSAWSGLYEQRTPAFGFGDN